MSTAQDLLAYLQSQTDDMVRLLSELVLAESPSDDPAAQDAPLSIIAGQLTGLGYESTRVPGTKTGGYLVASRPRTGSPAGQLLLGHCDTVWPHGTLADMPLTIDGNTLRGPGAFDMKAGLVQGIFALRALDALGLQPALSPIMLVNTDEEIGSSESQDAIVALAKQVSRVLVLEPAAGPQGKIKTERKGVGDMEIIVRGRSAHAGLEPDKGISAVLGMAELTRTLHALTDLQRGLTVNVGVISGGTRSNVVAAECRAEVDLRATTQADARWLEETIRALPAPLPGTTLEIRGGFNRTPLERTPANRELWAKAQACGRALGLQLEEVAVGGGSDGNLTSPYTATLDGLGPVGDGAHARHEFVYIDRLAERAALVALLMLEA